MQITINSADASNTKVTYDDEKMASTITLSFTAPSYDELSASENSISCLEPMQEIAGSPIFGTQVNIALDLTISNTKGESNYRAMISLSLALFKDQDSVERVRSVLRQQIAQELKLLPAPYKSIGMFSSRRICLLQKYI